jgi:hypothetical protein
VSTVVFAPADRGLFGFALVPVGRGHRLVVNLGIDPAENGTTQLVEVNRLIRIVVDHHMMRGIAGFD